MVNVYRTYFLQVSIFWFAEESLIKWLNWCKRKGMRLVQLPDLNTTVRPKIYEHMEAAI